MEDLSLHILDITENSISAGATLIKITVFVDTPEDLISIAIEDNGTGIPEDISAEVLDPFYTTRTTRKIGLGLSLLAQAARETGGDVTVGKGDGSGTLITARFTASHIDMKPFGDISETIVVLIAGNPKIDFLFTYQKDSRTFSLDTRQIKKELDSAPITAIPVLSFLRSYLCTSLHDINNELV